MPQSAASPAAAIPTIRSTPTRWGIVAVALAAGIAASMQIGKVPAALPLLREELGIGLVMAGLVASCITATGACVAVATGIVADRLGRRRLLLGGLACLAAGSLLGAAAGGALGLLATRLLEGIGFVAVVVSAPALVAEASTPQRQRLALGLWSCYMPFGISGMMLLTPPALGIFGWRGLWLAESLLLATVLLLAAAVIRGGKAAAVADDWREVRLALARPGPWLLAGCFATYTVQWFAVTNWLPTFMVERHGNSLMLAAAGSALVVFLNVPGNLAGSLLLQRGVPRWRLLATAQACMALTALGIFSGGLPQAAQLGLALAFSFIGGMLPAAVIAGVPAHARTPAQLGTTNGVVIQGANLGSMAGPPALAAMHAWLGGWQQSAWLLLVCGLAGIALAFAVRRVERRR